MSTTITTVGTIVTIALLNACGAGAGSDLEGVYQVTDHTINDSGCDAQGPEANNFTHFRLRLDELLGQEFLAFGECESSDPESCSDFGLFSSYIEMNGEFVAEVSSSSGGGTLSCALGFTRSTITETTVGELRIETRRHGDDDDTLSEAQCSPEEAGSRGTDMACERLEVLNGSLVQ